MDLRDIISMPVKVKCSCEINMPQGMSILWSAAVNFAEHNYEIKISHISFNSELEIIRFSCNFNTCQVQRILTLNHVKQATPSLFYGCKNCGEHILSVVNHSKTREQSFSMNSSYALNGTHEDRLGTNVTTLRVVWRWGKNEVELKAWSEGMKTIRRAEEHQEEWRTRKYLKKIKIT